MMLKRVSPKKTKKSPWIPPPGRTRHRDRTTKTQSNHDRTADEKYRKDEETLDFQSFCSVTSEDFTSHNVHLRSIKEEMNLLSIHFRSLKRVSLYLNRYFSTVGVGEVTLKNLLEKIDSSVKDIIYELDDLEYAVTLVENTLDDDKRTDEYLKMVKIKENLLSKVLDCYCKSVTIFESIMQVKSAKDLTEALQCEGILQTELEISEKKRAAQSIVIEDFERRLAILQGRANTIESYKSTLEATRTELEKQLIFKDSQIKSLNLELAKRISSYPKYEDKEELLEIIEQIKSNALAEKTALKKALKLQKTRTENAKESVQKLARDLKEKEKMIQSLAGQRDQLKLQLTKAKNNILEEQNEIQEMKIKNQKLLEELNEKESSYRTQMKKIEEGQSDQIAQLNETIKDKTKLQKELERIMEFSEMTANELNTLKSNCPNVGALLSQSHGDGDQGNALDDVRNLITLLQDTKDYFKNSHMASVYCSAIEDECVANANMDYTQKSILTAVEEIKEHLLELKEICNRSNKQIGDDNQESKLKDLERLFSECSKENACLKSEIEEFKMSKYTDKQKHSNEKFFSFMQEGDVASNNFQWELKLKTENCRLKQREKDLEQQLEEVKEKLHRKEMETVRLFSAEEELKLKKNELSILERKREEESEKSQRKIGELQESLDKVTAEYDSLKRYVQILKSSYLNVFGEL